ncbi:MAG: hypothetical protein HYX32_15595 [Actinobacteria bacterium]|nr:hypothetical protein [Actinomycetota bacterium]
MFWFFFVLTALVVIVIGLVAVGRVTLTLAEQPRPSSYELDEAVEFVADHLPDAATAQLSYDEVRSILSLHLDYLEVKGVAFEQGTVDEHETPTERDQHEDYREVRLPEPVEFPAWPEVSPKGPLVADDDEALPYILGRLAETNHEIDDVHVVQVLEVERRYLEAIGAIGAAVPSPDDPGVQ